MVKMDLAEGIIIFSSLLIHRQNPNRMTPKICLVHRNGNDVSYLRAGRTEVGPCSTYIVAGRLLAVLVHEQMADEDSSKRRKGSLGQVGDQ
jgi:hypothetical protein